MCLLPRDVFLDRIDNTHSGSPFILSQVFLLAVWPLLAINVTLLPNKESCCKVACDLRVFLLHIKFYSFCQLLVSLPQLRKLMKMLLILIAGGLRVDFNCMWCA